MTDTTHIDITHHKPSVLGTKEHWDEFYQAELDNGLGQDETADITNLESWFAENNAPSRILQYLTSDEFPLAPENHHKSVEKPKVLDLGCGNGSSLFELCLEGEYDGPMVGIDYSQQSVDLARKLWAQHLTQQGPSSGANDVISFEQIDFMKEQVTERGWWPSGGFDLVLDKGTFDAVSLSGEMTQVEGRDARLVESYPATVVQMVRPGGFLLVTTVNWTEDELIQWFTKGPGVEGILKRFGKVKYPSYEYGGRKGQALATVCFCKAQP